MPIRSGPAGPARRLPADVPPRPRPGRPPRPPAHRPAPAMSMPPVPTSGPAVRHLCFPRRLRHRPWLLPHGPRLPCHGGRRRAAGLTWPCHAAARPRPAHTPHGCVRMPARPGPAPRDRAGWRHHPGSRPHGHAHPGFAGPAVTPPTERQGRQVRTCDPPSVSTGLWDLSRWTNRTQLQQHGEVVADRPAFGDTPGHQPVGEGRIPDVGTSKSRTAVIVTRRSGRRRSRLNASPGPHRCWAINVVLWLARPRDVHAGDQGPLTRLRLDIA